MLLYVTMEQHTTTRVNKTNKNRNKLIGYLAAGTALFLGANYISQSENAHSAVKIESKFKDGEKITANGPFQLIASGSDIHLRSDCSTSPGDNGVPSDANLVTTIKQGEILSSAVLIEEPAKADAVGQNADTWGWIVDPSTKAVVCFDETAATASGNFIEYKTDPVNPGIPTVQVTVSGGNLVYSNGQTVPGYTVANK